MAKTGPVPKTANGLIIPEDVIFYYLRDKNNQPIACVAIADNGEGAWSRGVSICSPRDQFNRKAARKLAFGRLCKAFGTGKTSEPVLLNEPKYYRGRDPRVEDRLSEVMDKLGIEYKVGTDIELTPYEQQLVQKTKKVGLDKAKATLRKRQEEEIKKNLEKALDGEN